MSLTDLRGPFLLTAENIRIAVTATLPGAYALGHTDDTGTFIVEKVGRSDESINKKLRDFADCYMQFSYEYYPSAIAAFERECDLHHKFMVVRRSDRPVCLDGSSRLFKLLWLQNA
jgi:hypothetical protein